MSRSLTHKTQLDDQGSIKLSEEMIQELGWRQGDELVVALGSNGLIQLRNLTTKVMDVSQRLQEHLHQAVLKILPKGFEIHSLEPLVGRSGYSVQLRRPTTYSSQDYWSFLSELKRVGHTFKVELEVAE